MIIKNLTLGEFVYWDKKSYPSMLPEMINKYGNGPFEIVALRKRDNKNGKISSADYTVTINTGKKKKSFAGEWFMRKPTETSIK